MAIDADRFEMTDCRSSSAAPCVLRELLTSQRWETWSTSRSTQFYSVLGTCLDAQATRLALVGSRCVRNLSAVNPIPELRQEPQFCIVSWFDRSNFKYVVWAYLSAGALRLAARKIHDRDNFTLRHFAVQFCHVIAPQDHVNIWFERKLLWVRGRASPKPHFGIRLPLTKRHTRGRVMRRRFYVQSSVGPQGRQAAALGNRRLPNCYQRGSPPKTGGDRRQRS